jgi:hypothetical protein
MPEGSTVEVPAGADADIEEFTFTPILDDHDADVSKQDCMIKCVHGCS